MIDADTLKQFEEVLKAYHEDDETLQPIVTLAEQALGDNWTGQLVPELNSALAGRSDASDLIEKAEHAVHYYGALAAWEEANSYISGKEEYTVEMLQERLPVLEYWLRLFGDEGEALMAQVRGLLNSSSNSDNLAQKDENLVDNAPVVEEKTEKASVMPEPIAADAIVSDESILADTKENKTEDSVVIEDVKPEPTPEVKEEPVQEIKQEPAPEVKEEVSVVEQEPIVEVKQEPAPVENNKVDVETVAVEEATENTKVEINDLPKQEVVEEPKETKKEEVQPVEEVVQEESVQIKEAPQPEEIPQQEEVVEIKKETKAEPVSISEIQPENDKAPAEKAEEKKVVLSDQDREIPNLDVLESVDQANQKTPDNGGSKDTDGMSIVDQELSALEQLHSVNSEEPVFKSSSYTGLDPLPSEEKTEDVPKEKAPEIEDVKPADYASVNTESKNWDIAVFLRQKKLYDEACNWLSAWCVRMDGAAKDEYPHYGFIVDLMYDLRDKAHNILDNQLLDEIVEQDVEGGRAAVQGVVDALDKEIEGLPDDLKLSTAEKMKLSAREILGQIDTSNEKEVMDAPPDGFELMDDPYAISTEQILSDFEKTEQKAQKEIDNLNVIDENK